VRARQIQADRTWIGVGILPPHVWATDRRDAYATSLREAGAQVVLDQVTELTPKLIGELSIA
jgi:HAD superfamily phosphatase